MNEPAYLFDEKIKELAVKAAVRPATGELVVSLEGSVESYNAQEFETLLKRVAEQGHRQLVFDCTRLAYVSSIGIGVFMNLNSAIKKKGGSIVFAAVPEAVARVFDNLGFTVFFTFREKV